MENLPLESEVLFECDHSCERTCNPEYVAAYLIKVTMEELGQDTNATSITADISCAGPVKRFLSQPICNMTLNYIIYDTNEQIIGCASYEPDNSTQSSRSE